ncbi:MAG: NADPH:quinone oxidoreductase family protein [Sphingomonadaceae bacterium]
MKALLSHACGGPETLSIAQLPTPRPGPEQLLVRTGCAALNFLDSLIIEDLYQTRPSRPFSPGCEVSGTVEAVGEAVTDFAPGDRVLAVIDYGALAEQVLTEATRSFRLPDDMPFDIAAAMPVTYGTTIHALTNRAQLTSGQTLFVMGASSGVGLAAVQIGKTLGARVVAAVSSADKAEIATLAGADRTVVYPRTPAEGVAARALAASFKDAIGAGGAHIVYDAIGGAYCEPALRAIAWNGTYLVIGFAAGIPAIPTNLALLRECRLSGVFWGEAIKRDPGMFQQQFAVLMALWRGGKIHPAIGQILPLSGAADGIAMLTQRSIVGKIVIDMAL